MDNTDSLFKLNVESNLFSTASPGVVADIYFGSSDGIISSNTLHGDAVTGIDINGYHSGTNYDLTFVGCQNVITGSYIGSGIQSSNYQGYIKLDSINGVDYGWEHEFTSTPQNIPPHIVGTQILDCYWYGIKADATVDLSGVHHGSSGNIELPASNDIPGYNQIHDNSGAQIAITTSSANLWVYQDNRGSTWTQAGQNNIYQGSGSPTLIQGDSFTDSIVDIDTNYWGPSIVPPLSSPPTTTYWSNFNFTAPHGAISFTPIPSELSCSSEEELTKRFIKTFS